LITKTEMTDDSPDDYRITSSLDDSRQFEKELLEDTDEHIKTEKTNSEDEDGLEDDDLKDILSSQIEMRGKEVIKSEVVDDLELNEIDESSCHSWSREQPILTAVDDTSPYENRIPNSGRTTPDHEIQPPVKKGRTDGFTNTGASNSYRTAKHNTKREFTRKRQPTHHHNQFRERETDEKTIQRRQKQIDYGKVTVDYEEYVTEIPRHARERYHPRTPDKYQKTSRRSFDSQIKNWKLKIHKWRTLEPTTDDNTDHQYASRRSATSMASVSEEDENSKVEALAKDIELLESPVVSRVRPTTTAAGDSWP